MHVQTFADYERIDGQRIVTLNDLVPRVERICLIGQNERGSNHWINEDFK